MKTASEDNVQASASRVDEMENEHAEGKSQDQADMIRMGKAQQTKVRPSGRIKLAVD